MIAWLIFMFVIGTVFGFILCCIYKTLTSEAIKELNSENTQLQKEVNEMKKKQEDIESELNNLKKKVSPYPTYSNNV